MIAVSALNAINISIGCFLSQFSSNKTASEMGKSGTLIREIHGSDHRRLDTITTRNSISTLMEALECLCASNKRVVQFTL